MPLGVPWQVYLQIVITLLALVYLHRALVRTPARHAVYGIAALMGLYAGLKLTGMMILAGIMEQVLRVGVLVIVVLFRDEVRAILALIGKRARVILRTSSPEVRRTDAKVVEEIASAAETLVKTGYGGLIAVEMEDSLASVAETGTPVDSILSAPLLEAIFTSRSPLHDGAVIVRDRRIVAAGAVLQLFRGDTAELDRTGTRHRAALGLASATDAAVVVVSEEKGNIRVARHGRFIPINPQHTRRELVSVLTNEDNPRSSDSPTPGRATSHVARLVVGTMNGWDAMVGWIRGGGKRP